MNKKLTNYHFCYVIFREMTPNEFANLLQTNTGIENLIFLEIESNEDLYEEAKQLIKTQYSNFKNLLFEFPYKNEPYTFNKFIDGNLDRTYKICIFEVLENKKENTNWEFNGKTSNLYFDDIPLFIDPNGKVIKNSDN